MRFRECACVLLVFGLASASTAAVSVEWVPVDNTDALTGYTTVDLFVHSDTGICCAALLFELERGELFFFSFGDTASPVIEASKYSPPPQALLDLGAIFPEFAALPYTSYITLSGAQFGLAGGAGDVGGDTLEFSKSEVDLSWYSFAFPSGQIHMARLTFSNDSVGTWGFATVNEQNEEVELYGSVGELIPEPCSLVALAGVGTALLPRRRSNL